ncbi:type VI secretion system-associated protein TagF [Thalassococcus profundi]|uniref:Type VI secretion system-associated protein TagF n=1 Tax=Thalassococcus profundi TaxID=2282382 RepID=A0A369TG30_9RHOB|nr:type VI secretion system-associated protein TagF [Thalassococcus profundi]RDD64319.1 type VI secretion system-associated protein TagF [Thalassococcus profundi]
MPTGLFGKLPAAGDFVARGLAPGVQPVLDRWLTLHFAPLVQDPVGWPEGGVRALLRTAKGAFLLLIEPGLDAVGRAYPLVACVGHGDAPQPAADRWADAAWPHLIAALDRGMGPDALLAALSQIPDPAPGQGPELPEAPALWWPGTAPRALDTLMPVLAQISSGRSCSP